ncbi:SUMF1/EgtB/PvdO family nonheme iron enzyme [Myxococcota bacterium]|nr:SUMF1/EgtB/PvdO family nonheme iron enzyme [Myxococcota bacterium]
MSTEPTEVERWITDARQRTFDLTAGLDDEQLMGPRLAIVNPLLWEIGHVAWFQEKWALRHVLGRAPLRADADALYDSIAIPHDTRWDLPLPSLDDTLAYLVAVRDHVLAAVRAKDAPPELAYFVHLALMHEDMHDEAFTYTRQTLSYPRPTFTAPEAPLPEAVTTAGPIDGDAFVPGGRFVLGADPRDPSFVFDNEKWGHEVDVAPFHIAKGAVTQAEFARFIDDGGYRRDELWCSEGRLWKDEVDLAHPMHWKPNGPGRWLRKDFDRWVPIEPHRAIIHVSWYEADAYARWAGRRLPTEPEWEMAAACELDAYGRLSPKKRRYPWGDDPPTAERANLDWRAMGTIDVGALPAGDSFFGVRQMIGNVWEWTSTDFLPYPGFVRDPYKEYSEPWFGDHKVLRGGCWTTRGRLVRNTWRNFYKPNRRDVLAGFRTCRL